MKLCPFCGEEIENDIEKCPHCNEDLIKFCPICGEKIKTSAIKCKHCGEWLNKDNSETFSSEETVPHIINDTNSVQQGIIIAVIMVVLVIFVGLLITINNEHKKDVKVSTRDFIGKWSPYPDTNARNPHLVVERGENNLLNFTILWENSAYSGTRTELNCDYDGTSILLCTGKTFEFDQQRLYNNVVNQNVSVVYKLNKNQNNFILEPTHTSAMEGTLLSKFIKEKNQFTIKNLFNKNNKKQIEQNTVQQAEPKVVQETTTETIQENTKYYDDILNKVEYYQAQYWQIIKRHNCLINWTYYDSDTETIKALEKDHNELLSLMGTIENQININNPYYIKLTNISKDDSSAQTQYDLNMNAANYNDAVDSVLNELYNDIRKTIPASDFEKLKQSEIKWLNDIEKYKKVMEENLGGTIAGMIYSNAIADIRRFRCLALMLYFYKL